MKKIEKYISKSPQDTYNLGVELSKSFSGGEVLALYGNLGAGKTALTQGIAAGLEIKEKVNSPTFSIIKLYKVKGRSIKQLCHIDAYRLQSSQDLLNIGLDEYLGKKDTLTIIEWAEIVENVLKGEVTEIRIEGVDDTRIIKFKKLDLSK